tara:strand:+ start:6568 stop:6780 length:213 start_codon:yes stop_codon:yes gene_type:complete
MTNADIITAATKANLPAAIVGTEVHVTMTGPNGVAFRHNIIEAGATYLGGIAGRSVPMGCEQVAVRRFIA